MKSPKYNLNVGSGSHATQTAKMLVGIEEVLLKEKPDCLILYGDTNSTLAGALAASKLNIPIAHIEAGLRCFMKYNPEEQNRIVADHLATFNFTPSDKGIEWLAEEGITENVYNVGDVMVDSLLYYSEQAKKKPLDYYISRLSPIDTKVITKEKLNRGWYFSTIHRQENTDQESKIIQIFSALNLLDCPVILPLHPRTRHILSEEKLEKFNNIYFVEPLSYMDTLYFAGNAKKAVTDSGGLQKECYLMKVPTVIVAKNSCWAETFWGNWAVLAKPDTQDILQKLKDTEIDEEVWREHYGDGHASEKIIQIIEQSVVI